MSILRGRQVSTPKFSTVPENVLAFAVLAANNHDARLALAENSR